jgi:hypothetical protein
VECHLLILNQMEMLEATKKNIKKNKMEKVYRKLKNDLKWYKKSVSNVAFKQAETREKKETGIKETVDKKLAENTASRLVEEWWLGS